jgi:hypothetical protein
VVIAFGSVCGTLTLLARQPWIARPRAPTRFLLVRFPPTVVLRNIFLPHRQGKRKIKGCIELIKNQNANHFAQYLNFYLAVHDDNARAAGTDSAQQGIV